MHALTAFTPLKDRSVVLLSSGHVSSNPRLVKEADTLSEAGASVTVVATQTLPRLQEHDAKLADKRRWRFLPADVSQASNPRRYWMGTLAQNAYKALPVIAWGLPSVAEKAFSRITAALRREAHGLRADLWIAHNLAALPAAHRLARTNGGRLQFDAEDLHSAELPERPQNIKDLKLRQFLEETFMPRCDALTAASPMIAERYARRFSRPVTSVLNVFPLSMRPPASLEPGRSVGPLSLYWFSQTVGPGRGLESAIEMMAQMRQPSTLHLRGTCADAYRAFLLGHAQRLAVTPERMFFSPQGPPDDMAILAAEHDVGLSVELSDCENRRLCLTNKTFVYLLAGIPALMSNTPAQSALAQQLGDAACLVDLNDPRRAATWLDQLAADLGQLKHAKLSAWRLATERFNWDLEQRVFLQVVHDVLALPTAS